MDSRWHISVLEFRILKFAGCHTDIIWWVQDLKKDWEEEESATGM
jgi:hypothetical protein